MVKSVTPRKTARKTATAVAPPAATPPARRKKQAVVIVHGIGEQRPLETIREFVETVYQRDPALTPDDDPRLIIEERGPEKINRVWIVPDAVTGSNELRRITTPEHIDNRRTDFYEFYWADLTNGTPFEMITAWLRGILIRSPFRVPSDVRIWWSWFILWALTLLFAVGAILIAYPTAGPFEAWVRVFAGWLAPLRGELTMLLVAASVALLVYRGYTAQPIRNIKLLGPVLLQVIAHAIYWLAPTAIFADPRFWAGVFTALVGAAIAGVIVPYIGDIVRYVRATPVTVASREAIRNRGLDLLRQIHAKGEYNRVVLVGHSLGCFVAYDLLQLYWHEAGPDPKRWAMTPAVQTALNDADLHVRAINPQGVGASQFDPVSYRRSQTALHKALVEAGQGWLISDFVTMGSPIVHSAFLTAEDGVELERSLAERMLSASPPRPDLPNNSMLYDAGNGAAYPHHGAGFAAVRWTNIHDFAPFPLFGDVVSGKVPEDQFGPGVVEHPVDIRRSRIPILGRLLTHTKYWTNTTGNWAEPPAHIVKLREALNLSGG